MTAEAIADKLSAPYEVQEDEAGATDLEGEAQAGGAGQCTPAAQEGGSRRSPHSVTRRKMSGVGLPGGAACEGSDEKKSKSSAQDEAGDVGAAAKAGTAPTRGKAPVL